MRSYNYPLLSSSCWTLLIWCLYFISYSISALVKLSLGNAGYQYLSIATSKTIIIGESSLPLVYVLMACRTILYCKKFNKYLLFSVLNNISSPSSGIYPLKLFTMLLLFLYLSLSFLPYMITPFRFWWFRFILLLFFLYLHDVVVSFSGVVFSSVVLPL